MFDFIAIDFETATKQMAPCQMGLAFVENGKIRETFQTYINPERKFDVALSRIHGITADSVTGAPTFPALYSERLAALLRHYPFVAHNAAFDRKVIIKACERYNLDIPKTTFFCTSQLYQENYPDFQHYKLDYLCSQLGIGLDMHHNALSDAVACAELFVHLLQNQNTTIYAIAPDPLQAHGHRDYKPSDNSGQKITDCGSQTAEYVDVPLVYDAFSGNFKDCRFVITGDIPECSREQLSQMIEERGGKVTSTVGAKTNFVAVGSLDASLVADKQTHKSGKIKKAEALIAEGKNIKFIHLHDLYIALTSN